MKDNVIALAIALGIIAGLFIMGKNAAQREQASRAFEFDPEFEGPPVFFNRTGDPGIAGPIAGPP